MIKYLLLTLFLLGSIYIHCHEEHREKTSIEENNAHFLDEKVNSEDYGRPKSWAQWLGGFHFIFLHFPIALVIMTVISELFFYWTSEPIYNSASRFMLIAAAAFAIPTALFGFIYSYSATYEGLLSDFLWWHMYLGFATVIFALITTYIRERYGISKIYYLNLAFLFLLINITSMLGGGMTFGPYSFFPPILKHH